MFRTLDANFNRAREALRVLEDFARFELEEPRLTAELKALRHDLDALARPHARNFLAARDSHDIGRDGDLAEPSNLPAANFKRAEEAARSIEEHARGKIPAVASGAHRIRYALYALEPRALGPRGRVARARLYVLVDERIDAAREALRGGADVVQLRVDAPDLRVARRLADLTHEHGALFIVNNRADLAVACDADGVHVGRTDLPIAAARAVVGEFRIVGATTHSIAEARRAVTEGADYVSVGPMFPTPTKPGLAARGFEYLEAAKRLGVPHFCIGGITRANVEPRFGRVAVCEGVIGQKDPAAAARAIRRRLT